MKEQAINNGTIGRDSGAAKRKGWRKLGYVALGLVGALVLLMAVIYIVNLVGNAIDKGKIEPYGQHVTVDGKQMNVLIQGEGEETIVLLPGYGTAAPALDFKLLIDELSPSYKVVAIEPFGYGLSDGAEPDRTAPQIVSEVHEALQQLAIDRYILMGHSIAGIYAIEYVDTYPDEVKAFIGIDSSVPNQPNMDVELPVSLFRFAKQSGLIRIGTMFGGDPYAGSGFDEATKTQIKRISRVYGNNPTVMNEMRHIGSNFKAIQGRAFPAELPVLLFAQAHNASFPTWVELHQEQADASDYGQLVTMDGEHYLHHTHWKEIAAQFDTFWRSLQQAQGTTP
ncbi:alpha/beta hydrolase [Paenibacillus sp. 598K]|uniref:alpha/beta hydrolase n=1 Tax=Paenibacillus sp. 598K TaxID=1117987 RepID=UPI000FFABF9D|nr:alpha/beta hydrolase [Paenibacillus sp. 598K]GBF75360.1 alpha/beta hydrolase [Paenibacillus sp. 598K]